jgi:hypothetical protein
MLIYASQQFFLYRSKEARANMQLTFLTALFVAIATQTYVGSDVDGAFLTRNQNMLTSTPLAYVNIGIEHRANMHNQSFPRASVRAELHFHAAH